MDSTLTGGVMRNRVVTFPEVGWLPLGSQLIAKPVWVSLGFLAGPETLPFLSHILHLDPLVGS